MIIAVIGNFDPPPHVYALAEEVGRELAKRGITLVCGGLTGVMEAVCKGAKSEGGTTIGILPGGSPGTANDYVDIPVATNMGYARNVAVVSTGSSVIAVGGAFGTLSEIAYALSYGIPVVSLNSWPPHLARRRSARGRRLHYRRRPRRRRSESYRCGGSPYGGHWRRGIFRTNNERCLMPDAAIVSIVGREALDSRGNPTVEAEVTLTDGQCWSGAGTLRRQYRQLRGAGTAGWGRIAFWRKRHENRGGQCK